MTEPKKNYIDDKGNYQNVENLTLAQIYDAGVRAGIREKAHHPAEWIPITTEKISQKEKEDLAKEHDISPEEFDDCWRYTCPLPEDGQQVLVTTRVWGNIAITTFGIDVDGTPYFEEYEDEDDITAWMPLPKPYRTPEDQEA